MSQESSPINGRPLEGEELELMKPPLDLPLMRWSCEKIESTQFRPVTVLNPLPKTRAERAFHLVERALLRTLLAGKSRCSIFSQLPFAKGEYFREDLNPSLAKRGRGDLCVQ